MRPIDYIKKYNLEQDSKFSHEEFVSDLVIDFLTLLEVGNGRSTFKGFFNAVNAIRGKFDSIVCRSNNRITEELWKYFYATTICKLRDELFPLDAYRRLAKVYHPDKGGNSEMFTKITEALSYY